MPFSYKKMSKSERWDGQAHSGLVKMLKIIQGKQINLKYKKVVMTVLKNQNAEMLSKCIVDHTLAIDMGTSVRM